LVTHRFSPRPNRAHEIHWQDWGSQPFADADQQTKPLLLDLTASWCHWCHQMDETTYSTPEVISLINEHFIAIRVDADQYPHVQDRYIAGGWPTTAFLTPTGEVLWSGTFVEAAQFIEVANGVISAWSERREELQVEIGRRRKALDAARGRHDGIALVRREAADDVLSATIAAYDERNGGFGTDPKFPYVDAVELLMLQGANGNTDLLRMAEHTLDGMLSGELWDAERGGFYRYALGADWTQPRLEKLVSVNAAMLRIYSTAGVSLKRKDFTDTANRIIDWADTTLALPNGLWGGSQSVDVGMIDNVVYTNYNAQWIRALAVAGHTDRAKNALQTLLSTMSAPNDLMYHYRAGDGEPQLAFLLIDTADTLAACLAVGDVDNSLRLAQGMERAFWAEDGGFWDRVKGSDEIGVMKYRDKHFETNAEIARSLHRLCVVTGQKRYRAFAERILAILSPQAGRYGVAGANYAIAVEEFFARH
jgi:uncharacterized protein YyaL (SSP411 family)